MQDSLWVKWIHEVYTKGGKWKLFNPPITSSWAFKKIFGVKEKLGEWMENQSYSISEVYKKLLNPPGKVNWASWVWSRYALPKTRLIVWLALLDKLKTKDRLFEIDLTPNDSCPLCGTNSESIKHMFFSCKFSTHCLEAVMTWLRLKISSLGNLAT